MHRIRSSFHPDLERAKRLLYRRFGKDPQADASAPPFFASAVVAALPAFPLAWAELD